MQLIFLTTYNGKCSNIHGHRWSVEVTIQADKLKESGVEKGMVEDFVNIKKVIHDVVGCYDHSFIVEEGSLHSDTISCLLNEGFKLVFVDFRTTAENFAYNIYLSIEKKGYHVKSVTVYETPNNSATFEIGV